MTYSNRRMMKKSLRGQRTTKKPRRVCGGTLSAFRKDDEIAENEDQDDQSGDQQEIDSRIRQNAQHPASPREARQRTQTVRPRAAASCVPCHFLLAAPERPFASLAELKHKSPPPLAAGSRRQSLRLRLRLGLFPLKQSGEQECAPRNNRNLATFVPVLNGGGEGRSVWRLSADACAPGLAGGTPISWGTRGEGNGNQL